ncbi:MAG TPA: hypothetical protein VGM67_07280 [Gemmatimonadaceae bacterium]
MAHARNRAGVFAFAIWIGCTAVVSSISTAQVPISDSATLLRRPAVAGLRSGQYTYQATLESGTNTTIIGTRTVTISPATYGGSPTWLLLENRTGNGIAASDSLYLDFTSLNPVHWSSTLGDARVAAEFRSDTVFGGVTSPVGRRSMITRVPPGTLVNATELETVLRLAPLQTAWEDSTSMLSISLGDNTVLPTRMSVIGDDRVRVPAGTFDCWVVAVHADPARGLYWVTKENPMVVRSTVDVPTLGGAQLVNSLVSATP